MFLGRITETAAEYSQVDLGQAIYAAGQSLLFDQLIVSIDFAPNQALSLP